MLKIRFKRGGRKKQPFYRIVVMDVKTKRDGKALEELGFYDPMNKTFQINRERTIIRLANGVQPTEVVKNLLIRAFKF
uniref:Small ribosomal subunit protein bS16c n=1 Tax=Pleurocladia lacustris TaxID=246121 RepID=A0A1I9LW03_9PHAE|nr:30S ribosomal protein S16 [Pleurocladia lacustris]ANS57629.1 30S ribosomal protein S16 [Pleurocladia lacustris]ANS57773.1 30S ribosomal protein S16 [Pleurocladia lacustris]